MTIATALARFDALLANAYSIDDKIQWLSRLDAMVKRHIDGFEGGDKVLFHGYDSSTDRRTELLVQEPFDDMYLKWMEAQVHYYNGEYGKYNQAIIMFQAAYAAFTNDWSRNHLPLLPQMKYKGGIP